MLVCMPTKRGDQSSSGRRVCTALKTDGQPCGRTAVPGLTVCRSHGGATAASVRASRQAKLSAEAAVLWGINSDAGSISVREELEKLARNKLTDVIALRLKISSEPQQRHIGRLVESDVLVEYDIEGTVQSKAGTQQTLTKKVGVSVWVQELHRAEAELLQIMKLLHEVTGNGVEVDIRRLRMQTAREAARLTKAFPGISIDEVASEIAKKAS